MYSFRLQDSHDDVKEKPLKEGLRLAASLHKELSQQVGYAHQDQETVEEGRRPEEQPLPSQRDHVH